MSNDDFDIQSIVKDAPEGGPKPLKVVDLFRRGAPVDDSPAGKGELEVAVDDSPEDKARDAAAVKRGRETYAKHAPPKEKAAPAPAAGVAPAGESTKETEEPPPEESDAEFVASMRKREAEQRWRADAQASAQKEADAILSRAREEAAKHVEEARAKAAKEAREEALLRLRTAPGATLDEWGVKPDAFLKDIADAHTPEGQMRRMFETQQREIAALRATIDARAKAETETSAQSAQRIEAQQRAQREAAFVAAVSVEAAPSARLLHESDDAILREAYDVIKARSAAGKPCTDADIIADLEAKAQVRLSALRQKLGGEPGAAAPAGRATGPRALSAAATSERRSSPKATSEMSDDELLAHEAAVVRAAREKFKKTRSA